MAQKLLNFNSEFLVGSRVNLPIPSEDRLTGNTTVIHTVEDRLVEIRMLKVERLGRPAFFIIIKDITQETRQKAETERLRLLHQSMLVFAKEGVVGLNKEGNITYINQYALDVTGYVESEVLGQSFHSTFHHSWMDGVVHEEENSPIRETLLEGVVNRINNEIFWKKGDRYFYVEYISSPIKKEEEITGAVVLFKDITDKKQQRDLENKYHEELLFLSESAMKFLQIKERSEIFEYIAGAIFEEPSVTNALLGEASTPLRIVDHTHAIVPRWRRLKAPRQRPHRVNRLRLSRLRRRIACCASPAFPRARSQYRRRRADHQPSSTNSSPPSSLG